MIQLPQMSSGVQIGAEFAGYRIDSLLGRGGMSIVYLAQHLRLERRVALKVPTAELLEDDNFRERFVRESRLASAIDHPNIIPIYEAGEVDGVPFIAMRYVAGTDLKKLIDQEGVLDVPRALSIVGQVASALDSAHHEGLIHRDVKPANVLIVPRRQPEESDQVYLADFGLTKHSTSQGGLTKTGQFVGTIHYVAPEQIEGPTVDGRVDVYAPGCVLYECLVGQPPFVKDTDVAVIYAHLLEPPPRPGQMRTELPVAFDDVVARALAKSRDKRYPTCGDLMTAARAALTPPPPTPTKRREVVAFTTPKSAGHSWRSVTRRLGRGLQTLARMWATLRAVPLTMPHRVSRRVLALAGGIVVALAGVITAAVLLLQPSGDGGGTTPPRGGAVHLGGDGPATSDSDGATLVAERLFPAPEVGAPAQPCGGPQDSDYTNCPVTDNLAQRLQSQPLGPTVDSLCRCTSGYTNQTITITATDTGGIAHVTLDLGGQVSVAIDVVVQRTDRGWQASDITCSTGGATTSVFNSDPTACTQ